MWELFNKTILHHRADLAEACTELEQGQLSFLMNNKILPTSVSNLEPNSESRRLSEVSEGYDSWAERVTTDHKPFISSKEVSLWQLLSYELCDIVKPRVIK